MTSSRSIVSASSVARLAVWLVLAAVLVAWPAEAAARKRVAVLPFAGPKADKFQADFEKVVKRRHSVVAAAKWEQTADKLGATDVTDRDLKKVATALNVDAVIVGEVEKRGAKYYLHLELRAGATGKVLHRPDIISRAARLDAEALDDVEAMVLPLLDKLQAPGEDEDEDDEDADDDRGRAKPRGKANDDDRGRAKPRGKTRTRTTTTTTRTETTATAPSPAASPPTTAAAPSPATTTANATTTTDDDDRGRAKPRDDDRDDDDRDDDDATTTATSFRRRRPRQLSRRPRRRRPRRRRPRRRRPGRRRSRRRSRRGAHRVRGGRSRRRPVVHRPAHWPSRPTSPRTPPRATAARRCRASASPPRSSRWRSTERTAR
jgi:hypothetical protein